MAFQVHRNMLPCELDRLQLAVVWREAYSDGSAVVEDRLSDGAVVDGGVVDKNNRSRERKLLEPPCEVPGDEIPILLIQWIAK